MGGPVLRLLPRGSFYRMGAESWESCMSRHALHDLTPRIMRLSVMTEASGRLGARASQVQMSSHRQKSPGEITFRAWPSSWLLRMSRWPMRIELGAWQPHDSDLLPSAGTQPGHRSRRGLQAPTVRLVRQPTTFGECGHAPTGPRSVV
jgi:hypothetical protein